MKHIVLGMIFLSPFFSIAQDEIEERKIEVVPQIHFRSYWMSTSYAEDFKSDYSLGTSLSLGAKINYGINWSLETSYRGFADLWSSDIWEIDPLTGRDNRYEKGLYDLQNPGDRIFGSFERLNLRYQDEKWNVALGRMDVNTPWVNPQDGRLSPTLMEGISAEFSPNSQWKLSGWYIDRLRVRGTSKWSNPGESVGIFPVARDPNGNPSQYFGNTSSKRITVFQLTKKLPLGKLEISHSQANNISSTFWSQWMHTWRNGEKKGKWLSGLQLGYQQGVGEGGNSDPLLRYKNPNDKNWLLSARLGYATARWETHLNFTKTGGKGRWLNPREWGKDPWFTFIPRERNEGYENFEALVFYLSYALPESGITFYAHTGIHWLPEVSDAAANKYAFPSYRQLNLGVKMQPKKLSKMDFHLLLMNKEALNPENLTPGQRYNKVEMIHINGIINWRFN
ncbi:hypothetical protein SAMN04488104_1001107 [Algoriphagus faecimaris]|uniref:Capsule assembly protein Wzi n=1 Tax=Algoriphagus faecimaris TaxID=686796 RepID=A0A1G6MCE2_9BACT|nr:hypothetical protein [Algoriphagus faecimaris]SDC52987.1 hypothetical protein SAMN04488104_1001107 [Algoriphagus faecimaris]